MKIDIEKMEIMDVQPGDTLVITLKEPIELARNEIINKILQRKFPECKILVLQNGSEIHLVRGLD